ncbi:MAG: tripartite tricarboxylate transporter substrate binding protein, partial [Methylococcaceae bacterium]|nr:tripartite tricarboxylate transporter substrate binding protein [Methylococcaceae bacterium]
MKEIIMSGCGEARQGFCPRKGRLVPAARRAAAVFAIFALAILLTGITAVPLCAQAYPNRPIRFIFPFPPGGPTDILGRLIGQRLAERLGQPVVPENKPGAGANIGLEIGAKAKPDGYTITLASPSLAISPTLYKKLNYDSVKDFAPIALVAEIPNVLLVPSSSPIKTLKELIAYAKANPGKLNFGSGGIGTSNHLASELLKTLAKINIVHVPYKGSNQAMIGMMGGEVGMVVVGIPPSQGHIKAGKVRALAVLSEARLPAFPGIPTAKEAGIDNFEVTTWYGILAPAGTPREIITRLNAELTKIVASADIKEKMQAAGFEPMTSSPE